MPFEPVRDHHVHRCIITQTLEPASALGYHRRSDNQAQIHRLCCDTHRDRRGCVHFNRGLSETRKRWGGPHHLCEGELDLPDYRGQGGRCRGTSGHHKGIDCRRGGEGLGFPLPPETLHLEWRDHRYRSLERLPSESSIYKHRGPRQGRFGGCAQSLTSWT